MTPKTKFKTRMVALMDTPAGPSAVVTATLKRTRAEATFVFVEERELDSLRALVDHENGEALMSIQAMERSVPFRPVLRSHAIDVETGASPDDVDPFERATDRWPSGQAAWLQVQAWARYFFDHLLRWRAKHEGKRAPSGFTFNAIRRLAIAAGHDPADRDLDRLAETLDRLTQAEMASLTALRH